jgi:hypothetical protein
MLVTHCSPHPRAPAHPFTPKVLQIRECTPILYPSVVFTFGFTIEYIKEFGGALTSHDVIVKWNEFIELLKIK